VKPRAQTIEPRGVELAQMSEASEVCDRGNEVPEHPHKQADMGDEYVILLPMIAVIETLCNDMATLVDCPIM